MDEMIQSKNETAVDSSVLGLGSLPTVAVFKLPSRRLARRAAVLSDLLCFSHLRWDVASQRPQQLMSRFARERRVFYVEPALYDGETARLQVRRPGLEPLWIVTPHLPSSGESPWQDATLRRLVDELMQSHALRDYVAWYYDPTMLAFSRHLRPATVVYDCVEEWSGFAGVEALEAELFQKADLVFAGSQSVLEAKRNRHARVHCFPSTVDAEHFRKARLLRQDPRDQALLPHPRLGFFGVIDDRIDFNLLKSVAAARPEWQLILLGPICKSAPESLPRLHNIHYLGPRPYSELPAYLSGWDVALLPFVRTGATKIVSPTKAPEYLAAGRPVVSTSVRDVVRPYGDRGFVYVADSSRDFIRAVDRALELRRNGKAWLEEVDAFLRLGNWDRTWKEMRSLVAQVTPEPARAIVMS